MLSVTHWYKNAVGKNHLWVCGQRAGIHEHGTNPVHTQWYPSAQHLTPAFLCSSKLRWQSSFCHIRTDAGGWENLLASPTPGVNPPERALFYLPKSVLRWGGDQNFSKTGIKVLDCIYHMQWHILYPSQAFIPKTTAETEAMHIKKKKVLNFMKHWCFEGSSVLIKVQILGPQRLLIFNILSEQSLSFLKRVCVKRDVCQERYI